MWIGSLECWQNKEPALFFTVSLGVSMGLVSLRLVMATFRKLHPSFATWGSLWFHPASLPGWIPWKLWHFQLLFLSQLSALALNPYLFYTGQTFHTINCIVQLEIPSWLHVCNSRSLWSSWMVCTQWHSLCAHSASSLCQISSANTDLTPVQSSVIFAPLRTTLFLIWDVCLTCTYVNWWQSSAAQNSFSRKELSPVPTLCKCHKTTFI